MRIMLQHVGSRRRFMRKSLLGLACVGLGSLTVLVCVRPADAASGPAAAASTATGIVGTWQGTLHAGRDLRTVVKVTKDAKDGYKVVLYSIDQGGGPIAANSASFQNRAFKFAITMINGSYDGKMSSDGNSIDGTWTQFGHSLPLMLARATPETAWTIPKPPPPIPPMAKNADPSFEVATIKPSKPGQPGRAFLVRGGRFLTINTPLSAIICFAYDVQPKQIIGLPQWATTDKYDILAEPNGTGTPSSAQWKTMLQKLIANRFSLKFHHDKKVLPVYVLAVAKGGPTMTLDTSNPNGLPGLFFRGLGKLYVRNATMQQFADLMQSAVLDRPVLDKTGLKGKYDFVLKWTPDSSQFVNMGVHVPPPSNAANQPPGLYTAIKEQIGLKLEATKAPAEVMVIDKVAHPSPN